MEITAFNKCITHIVSVLPKNTSFYDDEVANYNFSKKQSLALKSIMGFDRHRIATPDQLASTFAIAGVEHLLNIGAITREEINAIVYVTESPDYFVPMTSSLIANALNLSDDLLCYDINSGCSGYVAGLIQAFSLLELQGIEKVVLVNADVLSKKTNIKDRNSYPLIGDGGAVSIVTNCDFDSTQSGSSERNLVESDLNNPIYIRQKLYHEYAKSIIIEAGGFALPASVETARETQQPDKNIRSLENLTMKGADIFSLVMEFVPEMTEALLKQAHLRLEDIDAFLFHQPNSFMVKKLQEKLGLDEKRLPSNIVPNFGNGSSITIPLNACFNFTVDELKDKTAMLAGFGVGLNVSALIMRLENLQHLEIIEI